MVQNLIKISVLAMWTHTYTKKEHDSEGINDPENGPCTVGDQNDLIEN